MNQTSDNIQELLARFRQGTATPEEQALLETWYHSLDYDDTIFADESALRQMQESGWQQVAAATQHPPVISTFSRYRRLAAAAAILLALLAGLWLFITPGKQPKDGIAKTTQPALQPPVDKAILTLADGQQIVLDKADSGAIAEENGVRIIKLNNGQLAYKDAAGKPAGVTFNTLTTPRGGQYKILLPDGTAVWMNSASSLTYPTAFNEKERIVTLSGEAYFDVASNARQPFKVKVGQTTVDVLGTGFNIHAYTDEPAITTTLVEGSIRVSNTIKGNTKADILIPGQQAIGSTGNQVTRQANLRQVLSWKNGLFIFEDRKLAEVLREISRWYDIDIDMQAPPDDTNYGGVINRNSPLPKVLELLERNGIRHFKIEGRKVVVLP